MFIIGGIQKTTLLDFPGKVAAIVFTQGCNFRCGYCHNPELLGNVIARSEATKQSSQNFINFLKTRVGKLDGVVITGGEPTLQNGLYNFIKEVKTLGFAVKLDTNGTNPDILEQLILDNMLDYVAMDIKAPIEKYSEITCVKIQSEKIIKSIDLIINSGIDYEFRTTVIKSQITRNDFEKIKDMLKGAKKYYLQKFIPTKIYDTNLETETTYSDEEFREICNYLKQYIPIVDFR